MIQLHLGVKTDPIEYRYSYDWLFQLLAEEGIQHVQLGSFFEMYQLPDEYFRDLRRRASDCGLAITSIFTAHRELGGFFRDDGPGWAQVARRNFERAIEVGALLGAKSVGSNPGAVLRDRLGTKPVGTATYVKHLKELLHYAADHGIEWVGIEPMSCLAEPPTLPAEQRALAEELSAYHTAHPQTTARAGYCADTAHGYADAGQRIVCDNLQLLEAGLPWTHEVHLKNTDAIFNSTFGFTAADRQKGVVDIPAIRNLLRAHSAALPVRELIGYLEIGGPKLGRDYSDGALEGMLRESLQYLKEHFVNTGPADLPRPAPRPAELREPAVRVAPSLMCADLCHLERDLRRLEAINANWLHFDVMDAHFVPNMPLGLETIRQLRPKSAMPFDVHLMVDNNDFFIRELLGIGVQSITIHTESATHLDRLLNLIRGAGVKAGVALNPATPLPVLDYVLESLDYVLLMTVNPGFAGQPLVPSAFRKIAACRAYLDRHRKHIPIQVDGNVSFANIPRMVAAGADILVAGTSSLFHRDGTLADNAVRMQTAINEGLAQRAAQEAS
ncbi:MAG: ribulose-phosphate 3-epimerase [Verrucomicrobiota bacterium]